MINTFFTNWKNQIQTKQNQIDREKELFNLLQNNDYSYEQLQIAYSWLTHTNLSPDKIIKKITE